MLTGCGESNKAPPVVAVSPVTIPPTPGFVAPVALPAIKAGDDARVLVARHRGALVEANGRLRKTKIWIDGVRKDFAKPPPR